MILNKKIIIAGTILFALFVNGIAFAASEDCEAIVDLEKGNLEIPCIGLYDTDGEIIPDSDTYTVLMDQRGNSLNWEVTFVAEQSEATDVADQGGATELSECSSQVQLDEGTLYIPCLSLEGENGSFEVYLEASQRGNSSNWKVLLVKDKDTGETFDYRTSGSEEEKEGDCPDENASQTAKDNHPECSY